MYIRQNRVKNRLGTLEGFGADLTDEQRIAAGWTKDSSGYWKAPGYVAPALKKTSVTTAPWKTTPTSTSAGEVLTGVGAILAALAPAAQTAIQTQAEATTARREARALRAQGQQLPPQVIMQAPASNTGLILAVVGGIAVVGVLIMVMSKKK